MSAVEIPALEKFFSHKAVHLQDMYAVHLNFCFAISVLVNHDCAHVDTGLHSMCTLSASLLGKVLQVPAGACHLTDVLQSVCCIETYHRWK